MSKTLAWQLELQDKMSRQAETSARVLDRLETVLAKVERRSDGVDMAMSGAGHGMARFDDRSEDATRSLAALERQSRRTARAVDDVGASGRRVSSSMVGMGEAVGGVAAGALAAATAGVGFLSVEFGRAIFEAKKFEQSTRFAFNALLGGSEKADAAFNRAIATAEALGASERDVLASFNALLPSLDSNVDRVDELVKSMADLQAFNPSANLEGVTTAIRQIAAIGKLQGDELMQLSDAGLATKLVYDELAKSLGVTHEELIKMQAAGKIGSDVAIEAIQAAIQKQTGEENAGDLAAKKSLETVEGQLGRLRNLGDQFIRGLEVEPEGLVKGFGAIAEVLSGPTGEKLQKLTGRALSGLAEFGGEILDHLADRLPDVVDKLEEMFDSVDEDTFDNLVGATKAVIDAIIWLAELDLGGFGRMFWMLEKLAALVVWVQEALESMGRTIENLQEILSIGASIGESLVDGIVQGIFSKAGAVGEAIESVTGSLVSVEAASGQGGSARFASGSLIGSVQPANTNSTSNTINISVTGVGDDALAAKVRAAVESAMEDVA